MTASNGRSTAALAFRLWTPEESTDREENRYGLSADITWPEFFERFFLPVILVGTNSDAKTIVGYRESVEHWRTLTNNPGLRDTTDYSTAAFAAALAKLPGRKSEHASSWTVKKHATNLNCLFRYAGPRDNRRYKKAQGLLDETPYIDRPRVGKKPPDGDFTTEEIGAMLDACRCMKPHRKFPQDVSIELFWKALVTVLYYSGLRIGSVMRAKFAHAQGEWIDVPPTSAKRHNGERKYLAIEARAAIEWLETRIPREYIFPWPNWHATSGAGKRYMWDHWQRLLAAAGIPDARRFGYHGLRRSHLSEVAAINPFAAQYSGNHSDMRTTVEHYINPRIVAQAIKQMPRIGRKHAVDDPRQMRLFE